MGLKGIAVGLVASLGVLWGVFSLGELRAYHKAEDLAASERQERDAATSQARSELIRQIATDIATFKERLVDNYDGGAARQTRQIGDELEGVLDALEAEDLDLALERLGQRNCSSSYDMLADRFRTFCR